MRDYFSDRVLFTEFFKSHFNSLTYLWFSKIVFKHKFLKILQKSVWAFEPIRARGFRYQNLLSVKLKELKCPINLVKSAKLYLLSNSYNRKLKMKNPSFGMPGTDGLTSARPLVSYALALTKTKFVFFSRYCRRDVGPIQIDQIIARPNLYNILEVSIFNN